MLTVYIPKTVNSFHFTVCIPLLTLFILLTMYSLPFQPLNIETTRSTTVISKSYPSSTLLRSQSRSLFNLPLSTYTLTSARVTSWSVWTLTSFRELFRLHTRINSVWGVSEMEMALRWNLRVCELCLALFFLCFFFFAPFFTSCYLQRTRVAKVVDSQLAQQQLHFVSTSSA